MNPPRSGRSLARLDRVYQRREQITVRRGTSGEEHDIGPETVGCDETGQKGDTTH